MKRKTPVAAAREAAEKRLRAHELRWSPKKHKHRKHVSASRDSRGVSPQRLARQTTDANKKESAAPGAEKMTGDGEFACDDIDLATANSTVVGLAPKTAWRIGAVRGGPHAPKGG